MRLPTLKKRSDFQKIKADGRRWVGPCLVMQGMPSLGTQENSVEPFRYGLIVSRKFSKKAVIRNRVRRRLKEALRLLISPNPETWTGSCVLIPRHAALTVPFDRLQGEVAQGLRKVLSAGTSASPARDTRPLQEA